MALRSLGEAPKVSEKGVALRVVEKNSDSNFYIEEEVMCMVRYFPRSQCLNAEPGESPNRSPRGGEAGSGSPPPGSPATGRSGNIQKIRILTKKTKFIERRRIQGVA